MARMHAEADRLGKVSLNVGSDLTREVNKRQMAAIRPQMESIERRLEDMDRLGIDVQASPTSHPRCTTGPTPTSQPRSSRR